MLPPHELKNKDFTRVVRGYNPVEVDEHIKFIIEKYTELYRENDELERKLKTANTRLEQFKSDEESIRSALINAQRASAKITTEANERAEIIIRSAKTSCDRIIAEFKEEVIKERDTLMALHKCAEQYKQKLMAQYAKHLDLMDQISPDVDIAEYNLPDDLFAARIVQGIKNNVEDYVSSQQRRTAPAAESSPVQQTAKAASPAKAAPAAIERVDPIESVDVDDSAVSGSATPKMIYRVKSVKETIKQLNKTITGKEDESATSEEEIQREPESSADMQAVAEGGAPASAAKAPLSAEEEFKLVYSTPENYEEEIKKTDENKK